jgi:hypothetical protein
MAVPPRRLKWLTIPWALLIGLGLVLLAGSVMLPSTKRARVDWDELRRRQLADDPDTPATAPTSEPTSAPAAETF